MLAIQSAWLGERELNRWTMSEQVQESLCLAARLEKTPEERPEKQVGTTIALAVLIFAISLLLLLAL